MNRGAVVPGNRVAPMSQKKDLITVAPARCLPQPDTPFPEETGGAPGPGA